MSLQFNLHFSGLAYTQISHHQFCGHQIEYFHWICSTYFAILLSLKLVEWLVVLVVSRKMVNWVRRGRFKNVLRFRSDLFHVLWLFMACINGNACAPIPNFKSNKHHLSIDLTIIWWYWYSLLSSNPNDPLKFPKITHLVVTCNEST